MTLRKHITQFQGGVSFLSNFQRLTQSPATDFYGQRFHSSPFYAFPTVWSPCAAKIGLVRVMSGDYTSHKNKTILTIRAKDITSPRSGKKNK